MKKTQYLLQSQQTFKMKSSKSCIPLSTQLKYLLTDDIDGRHYMHGKCYMTGVWKIKGKNTDSCT